MDDYHPLRAMYRRIRAKVPDADEPGLVYSGTSFLLSLWHRIASIREGDLDSIAALPTERLKSPHLDRTGKHDDVRRKNKS